MNKQELASKIWDTANELRGSMEAGEYKDYILGFIFYKFLSEKEVEFLINKDYEKEDIKALSEEDVESVQWIKDHLGYFIEPTHLFQSWIERTDFSVDDVRVALSAFHRNINQNHKKIFGGIFNTLEQGISKLGDTASSQTKSIRKLISIVNEVPTDNKDYDTLGYIYEYLISQFAAGAGKKSGEFFTPHEVSVLKSEIVAYHLQNRENIQIYDPTSGSGSLLLNIGHAVHKYMGDTDRIKYFAQEKIYNTYNLTRMNLVMNGVKPHNMIVRNGDTLDRDFPYFEENDPDGTYEPVFVDAVVSNPPYSQKYDTVGKEHDARFKEYGIAPKSKADYAFLLHCLYHIKSDGIVTIVLPHGVLFRGGEEANIRKKLIQNGNIETIIGLPENIFFGTGISTIIMVLKKQRETNDILFIDASKGFEKKGNKNALRSSDIKRILDTVIARKPIAKFAHLAKMDEIEQNEFNLTISRYINSNEEDEKWDLYATMFGGIPKNELITRFYNNIWKTMPNLYNTLFKELNSEYVELQTLDIHTNIRQNEDVVKFINNFNQIFEGYVEFLSEQLIENIMSVNLVKQKDSLIKNLFERFKDVELIDPYLAFQIFDDIWTGTIAIDIEVIQQDSFEAVRAVDPNMVTKKKDGKKIEVQEGWKGRIISFELIQDTLLKEQKLHLEELEIRQSEIQDELTLIIETLSEADGEYDVLNDANDKFLLTETKAALNYLFEDIDTIEINVLNGFLNLLSEKPGKASLIDYINNHSEIDWSLLEKKKDGTPSAKVVKDYLKSLQGAFEFEEDTFGWKLSKAVALLEEEKVVKRVIKEQKEFLHLLTKETIERLTDAEAKELLIIKWIHPYVLALKQLPINFIETLAEQLLKLHNKYGKTMVTLQKEIDNSAYQISQSLKKLVGSEFDLKGINELQTLLKRGEMHE